MSEWQPIETAPKDGTAFWAQGIYLHSAVICWWRHEYDDTDDGKYPWAFLEPDGLVNGAREDARGGPTHWMPLPKPPVSL
jgi:hypothetical protein